jgi:predicted dehydrogenase
MIEAFERAKLPLFVAYYRRSLPRFVKAKQIIDSGQLGRVTSCRYHITRIAPTTPPIAWRFQPEQSGGGLFLDIGSHVLDLLDFLLGEFVETTGCATASEGWQVEDQVALTFGTSRDVVGSASWNFVAERNEELLVIDGTAGRLSMEVLACSPLKLECSGDAETIDLPDPRHIQQPLIQSVVDDLSGRGKCPSTGSSAARTSKVMDIALEKFYGGRDDQFWKRRDRSASR